MVDQLGDEIEFKIITSNRDLGDSNPYEGVEQDTWNPVGKAHVFYSSNSLSSPRFWWKLIKDEQPDIMYLNSFFHPSTTMVCLLKRMGLLGGVRIILAPRGEFSPGAFAIKYRKKNMFRILTAAISLHRGVLWQASAEEEQQDIRRVMGNTVNIVVAPDLRLRSVDGSTHVLKEPESAKFVWFARISPIKNLLGAIKILQQVSVHCSLTIIGPVEDEPYWQECKQEINRLPESIKVEYIGELPHAELISRLREFHFLFFPTLGENFGHTIAEALDQGLPVLISDETPWRDLPDAGVGWDLPLNALESWKRALERCVSMTNDEYSAMSMRSRGYVDTWMKERRGVDANLRMFQNALSETHSGNETKE